MSVAITHSHPCLIFSDKARAYPSWPLTRLYSMRWLLANVCREKGLLLSFVYKFGWVARQCCQLPPKWRHFGLASPTPKWRHVLFTFRNNEPISLQTLLLALVAGKKWLTVTNTLAYCQTDLITFVKSFIKQALSLLPIFIWCSNFFYLKET
jgi:hypothetical protein